MKLGRAREIFSEDELFASRGLPPPAERKRPPGEAASKMLIRDVNIPNRFAALHKSPTDHGDTAYKRRPGRSSHVDNHSRFQIRHRNCNSGDGGRNTNPRLPEALC
jgi:hypothetical protein